MVAKIFLCGCFFPKKFPTLTKYFVVPYISVCPQVLYVMSWCFGCCVERLEGLVLAPPVRNEKLDNGGEGAWPLRFDLKTSYQPQSSLPKGGDWMDNAGSSH